MGIPNNLPIPDFNFPALPDLGASKRDISTANGKRPQFDFYEDDFGQSWDLFDFGIETEVMLRLTGDPIGLNNDVAAVIGKTAKKAAEVAIKAGPWPGGAGLWVGAVSNILGILGRNAREVGFSSLDSNFAGLDSDLIAFDSDLSEYLGLLEQARRQNRSSVLPPYLLGRIRELQGDFDRAAALYRESIDSASFYPGAQRLAVLLLRGGQAAEAAVLLERAVEMLPRGESILYPLAEA